MPACCKDFNAGMLRNLVKVKSELQTPDGAGGFDITFPDKFDMWAGIMELTGSEKWQQQNLKTVATDKFIARYRSDLLTTDKITYEGEDYNIQHINDVEKKKQWMVIMAIRGMIQ